MPTLRAIVIAAACGIMVEATRQRIDMASARAHSMKKQEELRAKLQRIDAERSRLDIEREDVVAALVHLDDDVEASPAPSTPFKVVSYDAVHVQKGVADLGFQAVSKVAGKESAERSTGEWVSIVYRVLTILFGLMVFGKLLKAPLGLSGFFVNASEEAIAAYSKHVLESPGSFEGCPDKEDPKELNKNIYQGFLLGARAYMSALTGVTIVYAFSLFFIPFKDMYPLFLGIAGWFAVLGVTNISTILFASGPYVYPVANNYPGAFISIVFTSLAGYSCYASLNGF